MGGKYGVKETKEALTPVYLGLKAYKAAKADDGKIDMKDLSHALIVIPSIGPAIDNITLVPKEFLELDSEDRKELLAHAAVHLGDLGDAVLIVRINAGLQLITALGANISAWK